MFPSQHLLQSKLQGIQAEKHRLAQQKYYWTKKGESITNAIEVERLRNQVSYLEGQLSQKESSQSRIEAQLNERNNMITQLQQQLAVKDANISQLQTLLSQCSNPDVERRLQELSQALSNEIQREQQCIQTISQLNTENASLKIFRDLVIELYTRYPSTLQTFVRELQQPGKQVSSTELNRWVQEQFKT
jgi:chromosome segregation ATPase